MARFTDVQRRIRRHHARAQPPAVERAPAFGPTPQWIGGEWLRQLGGGPSGSPYSWHTWVYTAVRIRAQAIATPALRVFTGDPEQPTPVEDGEWVDLFRKPGLRLRGVELMGGIETFLCLLGECFLVPRGIDGPVREGQVPKVLMLLPGREYAQPLRAVDGGPITGWRFQPAGRAPLEVRDEEVMQFRFWNPEDQDRGLSPLQAALLGIETDQLAARWNRSFYRNGAHPGGALVAPAGAPIMSRDQVEQQRKEWNDRHQGPDRAFSVTMLQGGVTYIPFETTHSDMQWMDQRKWSREEIAAIYQVPEWFLGATEDLKYATARESWRVLYEGTMQPEASYLQGVLNEGLIERYLSREARARAAAKRQRALWVAFDWSTVDALRDAQRERLDRAEKITALGYSRNEANAYLELGLPEIPAEEGGDERLVSFGLAPLSAVAADDPDLGIEADPEGAAPAAPAGPDAVQDTALNGGQIASLLEIALAVSSGELPPETAKATILASFPSLSPEEVDAIVDPAAAKAASDPKEPEVPAPAPPGAPPPEDDQEPPGTPGA